MSFKHIHFLAAAMAAVLVALAPAAGLAETPAERGKYLVNSIVACDNCHTPKGPNFQPIAGMEFAGGRVFSGPDFRAVVPNITPDKETGIGNWTDDQIINAIRNGKRPDGTTIGPPMAIRFYRTISDSDVKAIVAYLRTLKPIRNQVEKSVYKVPPPENYGPTVTHVPDTPRTDKVAYGRYLAFSLGHCMECHMPRKDGLPDYTRVGGGRDDVVGAPGGGLITAPNLTPGNPNGIAKWTDDQIKAAITTGMTPTRPLVRFMAFDWYKNMAPEDLDDIVAFLRSLKPVPSGQ
jgi:mono/diheme cytochrome c family protein